MAAPHNEQHTEEASSFIKTPTQLVTVVVLAFVVPISLIVMLATLVMSKPKYDANHPAMSDEQVAARIKPVGSVQLGSAAGAGGQAARSGDEVVKTVCAACHATGALNAPKIGDKAAWGPLIKRGLEDLTANAIKGKNAMPAKGGNPGLSDVEIGRAIVNMANQSGASFKEPAAAAAPAAAPAADAKSDAAPAAAAGAADGKGVYDKVCLACHAAGVAGAPKTGDKAAWAPRIKLGKDVLYASAIKGKNAMPPKGGGASLSDAEVKAAVDFLIGQAK